MFYYMHNNTNYQYKICWNKALTFGVGSIQLSFRIYIYTIVFTQYMQICFNPNVTTFQSNCAEGLHFSAFIVVVMIIKLGTHVPPTNTSDLATLLTFVNNKISLRQ